MKEPNFLKNIYIGEVIRTEMEKRNITKEALAKKMNRTERTVRNLFRRKSIKINRLIELSHLIGVNFLQVYLQKMSSFDNTIYYEDAVIIDFRNGITIIPSKKSRTADFTQNIHIGNLLKAEVDRQKMKEEPLSKMCCCSQSTISRSFDKPDIDTELLIRASYALNYDFIRNIYMPYMAVNEDERIANDCIADIQTIKITLKTISIITEKQIGFYHGFWDPK